METLIEVLQEIDSQNLPQKKITSPLKRCLKKFSFKAVNDLSNLFELAEWLYIYDYTDFALRVCQLVNEQIFKNNFNIWSPIEQLLILETRILRESGQVDLSRHILNKVLAVMNPHEDAIKRRLSFDWLNDDEITHFDPKRANVWRLVDLSSLFFIRELGEGESDNNSIPVDINKAEHRIAEYKAELKSAK